MSLRKKIKNLSLLPYDEECAEIFMEEFGDAEFGKFCLMAGRRTSKLKRVVFQSSMSIEDMLKAAYIQGATDMGLSR